MLIKSDKRDKINKKRIKLGTIEDRELKKIQTKNNKEYNLIFIFNSQ